MPSVSYQARRGQLRTYFDQTAAEAWERLTSNAPVGRIRATVRRGREEMRRTLLGWLPDDMHGLRLLDAGCGTGALSVAAAERGALVRGVELSGTMTALAHERAPRELLNAGLSFTVGDMLDTRLGNFDHVVAMDSLIHYEPSDMIDALATLAERTRRSIVFTVAPSTLPLELMHAAGRLFPRGQRAPAIEPVRLATLTRLFNDEPRLIDWHLTRTHRVSAGFYKSQAVELIRQ